MDQTLRSDLAKWGWLAALLILCMLAFPAQAADVEPVPADLLSQTELRNLYAGRTWVWGEKQGAYFAPDGRYSGYSSADSFGTGRWRTAGKGVICFAGRWNTDGRPARFNDCFQHRREKGQIYSRRLPGGEWALLRDGDLVAGDRISPLISAARGRQ